jgi:hypothetical protein
LNTNKIFIERVDYLLELANKSIATKFKTEDSFHVWHWVSSESFKEFETAALSFILNLYGEKHPYYFRFKDTVTKNSFAMVEAGKGIINSIKTEIEKGWLTTVRGLVSAEIFSDFLESAEYLLEQKYKDPAAVLIGSTLEEHLRQLCRKNNLPVDDFKDDKTIPKKASVLNNSLYTAEIYNKLDQKNITAWLDLRNHAAHGKYGEYKQEQVENMLKGVLEFITRNQV